MKKDDWWEDMLNQYKQSGLEDADKGVFDLPHQSSCDPQDQDENYAYERGWWEQRKLLGEEFKWA